jgi:RNA polymerase sigma-70 factor, ECF subfamily
MHTFCYNFMEMLFLFAMLVPPHNDPARMEDEALIQSIADGQSAALGVLYDRYGRLVFSLAYQILNDVAAAEEITQEVFMQIWTKAGTFQSSLGKVSTWLTSVTRHRAIDNLRRRRIRPEGHRADWDLSAEGDNPQWIDPLNVATQVENRFQRQSIRQAIAQLPKEQQQALALAFFQGLSHQEIADATGEPLGTVKTRIRLAMQKLRQMLDRSI